MGLAPGGGEDGDGQAGLQHEAGGGGGEVLRGAGVAAGLGVDPLVERWLGKAGDHGGGEFHVRSFCSRRDAEGAEEGTEARGTPALRAEAAEKLLMAFLLLAASGARSRRE